MNELLGSYLEDLKDNLLLLDDVLIKLKNNDDDPEVVNSIFRVAHTIKGNSASMEFMKIESVMHSLEDILQEVRSGKRQMSKNLIELLFSCHDFLEDCEEVISKEASDEKIDITQISKKIEIEKKPIEIKKTEEVKLAVGNKTGVEEILTNNSELLDVVNENCRRGFNAYKIKITFAKDIVMKSVRVWMVFEKIDSYSTFICSYPERPQEEEFRSGEYNFEDDELELIVLSEKDVSELSEAIKDCGDIENVIISNLKVGENVNNQDSKSEKAEAIKGKAKKAKVEKKELIEDEIIEEATKEEVKSTISVENKNIQQEKHAVNSGDAGFIRVPVGKVDSLIDMLGELLILNSQLEQTTSEVIGTDNRMLNVISRTAKLIKGIQGVSMSLRMVEIKPILHRLTRIARDTATELGKNISVVIEGEDTEIDRSAADKLFDPLMHLVRNAVSHGIEEEEERVKAGKKPEGEVTVKAYTKRGNVYIEVCDDGKGLDITKIYNKAKTMNLIDDTKEYTEEEIIKFIFLPGFSTQEKINNISGRGVGMNVVEEEIRKVGGKVEVYTKVGHGSTFILKIPLNLAVLNGTIVEVNSERYIIPTLFIKEFFIAEESNWVSMQGKLHAIQLRGHVIPVLSSGKIFNGKDSELNHWKKQLIILEMEQKLLALPVDKIVSRHEVVSKPLDRELAEIEYASSASILGDGLVTLILDVEYMFKVLGQ